MDTRGNKRGGEEGNELENTYLKFEDDKHEVDEQKGSKRKGKKGRKIGIER